MKRQTDHLTFVGELGLLEACEYNSGRGCRSDADYNGPE
jgi:hypothetical protein